MGKIDIMLKNFMNNNERFSDAFNFLFNGIQTINKENLQELDSNESIDFPVEDNKTIDKQVYRDLLKSCVIKQDDKYTYLILGIENQTYIDYTMPLRIMLYDVFNYNKQIESIKKKIKDDKIELSSDEFLSGIRKTDKLKPIISLIIFFSPNPWNGHKCLHEMLDINDNTLLEFIGDYKINLIEPNKLDKEDFNKFKSDLNATLEYIKCSNSKKELEDLTNRHGGHYVVSEEVARVIATITNIKIDHKQNKGGRIDMCIAVDEMIKDAEAKGITEGRIEGITEGKLEGGIEMLISLVKDGLITLTQASKKVDLSEEEFKTKMIEYGY